MVESDPQQIHPDTRAHHHMAARAVEGCSSEEVAAALKVLDVMMHPDTIEELAQDMTCDEAGRPLTDTPQRRLMHKTWLRADGIALGLHDVREALGQAAYARTL